VGSHKNISAWEWGEGGVESGKVVYLADRGGVEDAKEYAVLFRLDGEVEAQFKVFGDSLLAADKAKLAAAMEAAARTLRA
jgi:hypothetical protein